LDENDEGGREPIKTTGIYTVRCKLGYEITADLRVEIKEQ